MYACIYLFNLYKTLYNKWIYNITTLIYIDLCYSNLFQAKTCILPATNDANPRGLASSWTFFNKPIMRRCSHSQRLHIWAYLSIEVHPNIPSDHVQQGNHQSWGDTSLAPWYPHILKLTWLKHHHDKSCHPTDPDPGSNTMSPRKKQLIDVVVIAMWLPGATSPPEAPGPKGSSGPVTKSWRGDARGQPPQRGLLAVSWLGCYCNTCIAIIGW